jgi:transposase InsO family protein
MDVKYQLHLLTNKSKTYVYNFIDHASNWAFKFAYDRINARNTKDFMNRIQWECPFKIDRLQTDNGVEFTSKYLCVAKDPEDHLLSKFCSENEINHKLIPPGEKELQGLVERSHRQDDQELFSRINPKDLKEFNDHLSFFKDERNRKRRFKKLKWKTPYEWLQNYLVVNMAIKLILEEKDVRNLEKTVTICKLAA